MKKKTTDEFIKDAKNVHGDKYDYSYVQYNGSDKVVIIVCKEHGEFSQRANKHLRGQGCPHCGGSRKLSNDEFISKANEVNNGKYDYSKVKYVNANTKVCIICKDHGEFLQKPLHHLNGHGCPQCGVEKYSSKTRGTRGDFITKANIIHGGRYDYHKVDYVNSRTKVCIVCPKHGSFWQVPHKHIKGQGCPKCKRSHLETEISQFLDDKGITYIEQANRKDLPWLGLQRLDFYLPNYNVAIECQGRQHFIDGCDFGSKNKTNQFAVIMGRDKLKLQNCQKNGVKVLYYSNLGIKYPYQVYEDKKELLQAIKEY